MKFRIVFAVLFPFFAWLDGASAAENIDWAVGILKTTRADAEKMKAFCDMLAHIDRYTDRTTGKVKMERAEKEVLWDLQDRLGLEFDLAWSFRYTADQETRELPDYAMYRDTYNDLVRACPERTHWEMKPPVP